MKTKTIFILLLCVISSLSFANKDIYRFQTARQEQTFQKLTLELRCLVCQNQTLAESQAPLAKDLRRNLYIQVQQGKNEKQVIQYLVKRYGDFILYNPPLQKNTLILWLGPFLFLLIALIVLGKIILHQRPQSSKGAL